MDLKAIAIYNFDAKSGETNELSIKKNDILDVIEKHDGWWEVKNVYGKSGLVPLEFIAAPITEDMKVLSRGKIKEDYEANTDAEVTVKRDCQVAIIENSDDYWWFIGFSGMTGYIPQEKIRVIQARKTSTTKPKIKQPFEVAPDKAHCEENATILIAFKKKLPDDGQFIVVFKGDHCEKAVDAEKFNEFTLKAISPKYHPAESTKMIVNHQKTGEAPAPIGKGVKFTFESRVDLVHRLLVIEVDPISFLRSSFQIENTQNVDHILSGLLEKRIPEGFNALKSRQCVTKNEDHPKETPTLLHFAAFYNLSKLAKTLLGCPGAEEALRLPNCHGMVPHALAEFKNNEELAKLLLDSKSAVNLNKDNDDIYLEMESVYDRYTKMDDDSSARYVTAKLKKSTSSADDAEIYEDMATSEPEEHYDTPRPEDEDRFGEEEEVYDEVNNDKWEEQQATQRQIDEFKVYGRMTEKEVQLALLMKRVKEQYITQEQALEMARVLRLEPQVGAPPVRRKPKIIKKLSGPVMGELTKKIKSLPRTCSTSSGSSMSSVGSNGSVASSGYTSGETDRVTAGKSTPEFPKSARKGPAPPTRVPRKSAPPIPGIRGHPR